MKLSQVYGTAYYHAVALAVVIHWADGDFSPGFALEAPCQQYKAAVETVDIFAVAHIFGVFREDEDVVAVLHCLNAVLDGRAEANILVCGDKLGTAIHHFRYNTEGCGNKEGLKGAEFQLFSVKSMVQVIPALGYISAHFVCTPWHKAAGKVKPICKRAVCGGMVGDVNSRLVIIAAKLYYGRLFLKQAEYRF